MTTNDQNVLRHVLLVEDNPLFAAQLSQAVQQLPGSWEVSHFHTGQEALTAIRKREIPYSLVLVDIGLPDMSGIEVIRICRDRFPEMPIVVVSVIAAEQSVLDAIRAGASGYILKSQSMQQITRDVAQVLDGIYPLSPQLARFVFKQLADPVKQTPKTLDGYNLSPREIETLEYLGQGNSYVQVAALMGVALSTIQSHIRSLYRKLNVNSQVQAIRISQELNLSSRDSTTD